MSRRSTAFGPPRFSLRTTTTQRAAVFAALAGVVTSRTVRAADERQPAETSPQPIDDRAAPLRAAPPPPQPAPLDASLALARALAAYEYGDIDDMVVSARVVADGRSRPTNDQRVQALRLVGIGLYLLGRPEGAETAFYELLRLRPSSRLDPRTARPDVVAFFEDVRRRRDQDLRAAGARASNGKFFWLNFLPPGGQFQNGQTGKAIVLGGVELGSLAAAVATYALFMSWQEPDHTFGNHAADVATLKLVNGVTGAVFIGSLIFGILDGIAHSDDSPANHLPGFAMDAGGLTVRY